MERVYIHTKKIFFEAGILVFAIFILNTLASTFYWYASIWWFDMPMHFLGGFWIGYMVLFLYGVRNNAKTDNSRSLLRVFWLLIVTVLIVGLCWEVFEFTVQAITHANLANPLDSASDVFFDLAGGVASYLYAQVRGKIVYKNDIL